MKHAQGGKHTAYRTFTAELTFFLLNQPRLPSPLNPVRNADQKLTPEISGTNFTDVPRKLKPGNGSAYV